MGKDLLGLQSVPAQTLRELLGATRDISGRTDLGESLRGRVIANLFFEDSTRTRTSFSVASMRLGAGVVDLLGGISSVSKGETLIDTARNVEAMGVAAFVVRAKQAGSSAMIAGAVRPPVINAGDGRHEHPTQGLLDTYTLAEAKGRLEDFDLAGLKVAIVGDIASSRVARSAMAAFTTLGADVVCAGPPGLAPKSFESLGVKVVSSLDEVLGAMDAVMMLRIQFERHGEGKTPAPAGAEAPRASPIASVREYRAFYALTPERAARMKKGAIVMHPGPINRGIELDEAVADGPRSVIMRQVTNGVLVRMAVLRWCLGEA
ncbi:aspartate carbamoyltransferase catalytic subunit [Phycisphaerales bacterium]|nr:aspartate carbamoyltransferase catalytic subunit [Phycisphaerales bacterium]